MQLDFKKLNGLIPVIIQDSLTKQVLMLGFMNKAAYQKTLKTKKVTFWSRSKKRLWTKGEESGNYLKVIKIKPDCDNDTLLILATPVGNTCHKDIYSCFGKKEDNICFLEELYNIISSRKKGKNKESYVYSLFQKGLDKIAQKVGEEATEVVIASKNNNKKEFIGETADLVFHLLVLLNAKEIKLNDVVKELNRRSS